MSDVIVPAPALAEAIRPPAFTLGELAPWGLFGVAMLALLFLVGVDGQAAGLPGAQVVHELVHDGRHLLGLPCH